MEIRVFDTIITTGNLPSITKFKLMLEKVKKGGREEGEVDFSFVPRLKLSFKSTCPDPLIIIK